MPDIINRTHTHKIPLTVSLTAYTDGDVVGGLIDLTRMCGPGGGGIVRQVRLVDNADQSEPFYLYLFDEKPTVIADADPFISGLAEADGPRYITRLEIAAAAYVTLEQTVAEVPDLYISHGTGQLWAYLVANGGTPDYVAVDDLTLIVTGWID